VHDLVVHLARRGVHVTLVVPPSHRDAPPLDVPGEACSIETVPYVSFPFANRRWTTILDRDTAYPLFGWRAGRRAERLVAAGAIDIVHALGASGLGYARARRANPPAAAPFVLNPQGLEEFGATDPQRARLKRLAYLPLRMAVLACARGADRVIATDRALVPFVLRHLRVDPSRVPVVPNAVDIERIDQTATQDAGRTLRSRHGVTDEEVVLVSIGRIEENKGFHVLADALARLAALRADLPRWRWVLVGHGPFRGRLLQHGAVRAIESRMIVTGRVDDRVLHAWLDAADLFVHPTLYEGSSLVTLEAMAHRLAVVATRAGGLPDKVVPGTTGWLVPPGDAAALTEALADAIGAGPEERRRRGEAGRALAEREFAWPAVAGRLIDVYKGLKASGGSPSGGRDATSAPHDR
jgi:glycogen synthase